MLQQNGPNHLGLLLNQVIALMSTGPVGISDMIGGEESPPTPVAAQLAHHNPRRLGPLFWRAVDICCMDCAACNPGGGLGGGGGGGGGVLPSRMRLDCFFCRLSGWMRLSRFSCISPFGGEFIQ